MLLHHSSYRITYILLAIFLITLSLSIPPLQSPDEGAHIKRAYTASQGKITLETPLGKSSGGNIDTGLIDYLTTFDSLPFKPNSTLSRDDYLSSKKLNWTYSESFSEMPGTGFYFPAIYTPQALAFITGQKLGLHIDQSYRLARIFNILASLAILAVAIQTLSPPPLVIALLILPMSLFQFMSASIDGVSTALTVLAISLFISIYKRETPPACKDIVFLSTVLLIICTSRAQLSPLLILLLIIAISYRSLSAFISFATSSFITLAWTFFTITHTIDNRVTRELSTAQIAAEYIHTPLSYCKILLKTVSTPENYYFYGRSFLGILGYLDTPLTNSTYIVLSSLLLVIALLSISWLRNERHVQSSIILVALSTSTILLIFFALAISWTPYPTEVIQGVQGRYFIASAIILAYGLSPKGFRWRSAQGVIASIALLFLFTFSIYKTNEALLMRYFMRTDLTELQRKPSSLLSPDSSIDLSLLNVPNSSITPPTSVSVQFATYRNTLSGTAKLTFYNAEKPVQSEYIDLSTIKDNEYHKFNLPPQPITNIKITSDTEISLSTWQVSGAQSHAPQTCIIYKYQSGRTWRTPGC
ncbi:DUF2142 domain-containing protein [Pseudomonas citronellolis]|uniref:DUF2142 domain-containing protein n=1 Tax=Pseudomonas citronellolis TaxID=53408 RepID=UPI0018D65387|nr:DUF2142 domain-containing protein [Pseudomonas citronellolis]MBH3431403.1 DUF2142 domain-containing protein [Pseudomonas citronellolis]